MRVARGVAQLSDIRDELTQGQPRPTVALVPTMGALHAGHRSLLRIARNVADVVVVSIFVNPLQFGPDEDYARYPRILEDDLEVCAQEEVDIVFVPSVAELYPSGRQVTLSAGQLGLVLEGEARPGHYDGVLTITSKLLNLVRPDKAIFGQKDPQQLAVVRKMAADLNCDVDIVAAPVVRDADGLVLSSRNGFLLPQQRTSALALSAALRAASREQTPRCALEAARTVVRLAQVDPAFRLDYLELVHPVTFGRVADDHQGPAILQIAAWIGDTRLIDHADLEFTEPILDDEAADFLGAPARVG